MMTVVSPDINPAMYWKRETISSMQEPMCEAQQRLARRP